MNVKKTYPNLLNKKIHWIENYLWIESILNKPPVPYGSFKKAKYIVYKHTKIPLYFFTTTVHNTEECIEIMKRKFYEGKQVLRYCKIFKIQNGIKELVFTDKPFDKP